MYILKFLKVFKVQSAFFKFCYITVLDVVPEFNFQVGQIRKQLKKKKKRDLRNAQKILLSKFSF